MSLRDTLRHWLGGAERPREWRGRHSSMEAAQRASGLRPYQALASEPAYIASRLTPAAGAVQSLDRKHALLLAGLEHCLAAGGGGPLRVIDFGGGLGLHYHRLAPALPSGAIASWSVVELPEVAEAGRRSATPPLHYYASLDDCLAEAAPADLCLAAGVMQTLDQPFEMLERLARAARWLLLASLPVTSENADFVACGEGAEPYPLWFFSAAQLRGRLEAAGLELRQQEENPETTWLVNGVRTPPARTLLLERRA